MSTEHVDVVIVGAGLSGIGAGYHLQTMCPDRSYVILEGREDLGGTWDLFRYPGVRSDSDMHTLGFSFKPWTEAKSIADGPSILQYLRDTTKEYSIDKHIRYRQLVTKAEWSGAEANMDNHVNAQRDRCANRYDVQLPVYVLGVLQLQKGTRTCICGARTVCRNHHSSSAMARQPRLRQQACGGHRFGCNCRHHRSVDGEHCLACDHGAAFANVCCCPP